MQQVQHDLFFTSVPLDFSMPSGQPVSQKSAHPQWSIPSLVEWFFYHITDTSHM